MTSSPPINTKGNNPSKKIETSNDRDLVLGSVDHPISDPRDELLA
jgi:hypothetical protein